MTIASLPKPLLQIIFSHLPVSDVFKRAAPVCSSWRNIIYDDAFERNILTREIQHSGFLSAHLSLRKPSLQYKLSLAILEVFKDKDPHHLKEILLADKPNISPQRFTDLLHQAHLHLFSLEPFIIPPSLYLFALYRMSIAKSSQEDMLKIANAPNGFLHFRSCQTSALNRESAIFAQTLYSKGNLQVKVAIRDKLIGSLVASYPLNLCNHSMHKTLALLNILKDAFQSNYHQLNALETIPVRQQLLLETLKLIKPLHPEAASIESIITPSISQRCLQCFCIIS